MKIQIFLLASLFSITSLYCQEAKDKVTTLTEDFSAQSGTLIEKSYINVGSVKGVEIKIYRLLDIISGKSVSGLRFEYVVKETYGSDTKIAGLDVDEVDGLIKSLKALQISVFPTTRTSYTEVSYKSRSGFEAGAYYDDKKTKWNCYLQIEKHDRKSMVFLSIEDFAAILKLVEEAKVKL